MIKRFKLLFSKPTLLGSLFLVATVFAKAPQPDATTPAQREQSPTDPALRPDPHLRSASGQSNTIRERSFDRDWQFFRGEAAGAETPSFDDSGWRSLDLPHDWSIEDLANAPTGQGRATADPSSLAVPKGNTPPASAPPQIGPFDLKDSPGQGATGYTVGGEGWYRKHFRLSRRNQHVEVRFDGVYQDADFWLNGTHLGFHPYGYSSFFYDLTPYLNPRGTNVLAVRVRNLGRNSRWYSGSGIIRHVWLIVTAPLHIPYGGVQVTTPTVSEASATVHVKVSVVNDNADVTRDAHVLVSVLDAKSRPVGRVDTSVQPIAPGKTESYETEVPVERPALWSPDSPRLYQIRTDVLVNQLPVDSTTTVFGIRSIVMNGQSGFLLNGKEVKMRGACVHHDLGALGAASLDRAEERRIEVLKAAGFNAIRTAHNPPSPTMLDACDRLGIMVYEEAFDMWREAKNPEDDHLYFPEWGLRDIAIMVQRDRNHPSVVLWSIGNEIYTFNFSNHPPTTTIFSPETGQELANRIRALDPTRPLTEGGWAGDWSLLPQSRTVNSSIWSYLDLGDQHYQHDDSVLHAAHPDRALLQSESFPATLYDDWKLVTNNKYAVGDFTWTGWDYLGESAIAGPVLVPTGTPPPGTNDNLGLLTSYPYPWFQAFCGDIDLIGERKPQWYYRTVVWGDSPLEMAVERPVPDGMEQRANCWSYYDELQSWTWNVPRGQSMRVRVYTSGDQIVLLLNGRRIATKTLGAADKMTTTFDVPYAPGQLTAAASKGGREIGRKTFTTVGAPAALRLAMDARHLSKNRNDLAYVLVEVVDAAGRAVPDAVQHFNLTVKGAATLAGIANANPHNVDSFQRGDRFTYHGKALAIVRPTGRPGRIFVHVSAEGLTPATLNLGQESGVRGQESGVRSQESGARSQEHPTGERA
jgi:beta-galactosidase